MLSTRGEEIGLVEQFLDSRPHAQNACRFDKNYQLAPVEGPTSDCAPCRVHTLGHLLITYLHGVSPLHTAIQFEHRVHLRAVGPLPAPGLSNSVKAQASRVTSRASRMSLIQR